MELWLSVRNHAAAARDVVVQIDPSHAVADLAVALLRHLDPDAVTEPAPAVRRGHELLDPAATVAESGLQRGDDLTLGAPEQDEASAGAWLLRAVGGPCTGRVWPLPNGTWTLGREDGVDLRLDDAFASRRHLQLDVGTSGVEVTDLGSANGTILEGEAIKGRRPLAAGEIIEAGSSQLEVVDPSREAPQRPTGDPDPLHESVEAPLRSLPTVRRGMRRTSVDLGEARRQLDARCPGVGRLADRVETRSARRDRVLRVGFGTLLATHEGERLAVPSAPLTVDLDEVAEVVCAGPDPDGLARSLVLQLAVAHGPQELTIAVAGGRGRAAHWSWAAWLPHTRAGRPGAPSSAADLLAFDLGEAATLVRSISELTRLRRVQDERHVLVLDATLPFGDGDLPSHEALRRAGILVIWVGTPPHRGEVHIVPSGEDGSVTIVGPGDRDVHGDGADHVDQATARELALAIARRDHHADETLPPTVGIHATVGTIDAATLQSTWATPGALRWVIGVGANGPVHVELSPLSPHLMVAGDHRSGGSTVLRTSIAGMAASLPPTELGLVLVGHDVRAFGPLTDLPHVVAVVTEHGSAALSRALLEELASRRSLVERLSARSLPALREAGAQVPPRLVVVVDGLDGASANGLADAIVHGPALDVHVIASLTGTESRSSLAGVANRIQLRTSDPGVSLDVLGTTQGLSLPADRAGRAWIRLADGAPQPVQIASAAVPRSGRDEITVTDLAAGRPSIGGHTAVARTPESAQDVLAELVQAAVDAAASVGGSDWTGWLDGHVPDARARKTFMFTDIVGSTDLVHAIGDEAWTRLLAWHDEALRRCFADHGGVEVGNAGDGFFVAFADPASATTCAIDIQRQLDHHRHTAGFAPQVRIGVHEAEAQHNGERFTGHGVHVAARVGGVGGPGEIVASLETARLAGATTSHPRSIEAKGVPEPLDIVTVQWRT